VFLFAMIYVRFDLSISRVCLAQHLNPSSSTFSLPRSHSSCA
jgi:hypothetical protein